MMDLDGRKQFLTRFACAIIDKNQIWRAAKGTMPPSGQSRRFRHVRAMAVPPP
jgi:hypothetical protein